jgi:uncharacterized protein (DUF433 family)
MQQNEQVAQVIQRIDQPPCEKEVVAGIRAADVRTPDPEVLDRLREAGIPAFQRGTLPTELQRSLDFSEHLESVKGVCGGRPVVRGTRIDARHVWHLLEAGRSVDEVVAAFSGQVSRAAAADVRRIADRVGPDIFEYSFVA